MKIIKGNFGECRICDNMDKEFGLPSLEEKSWDLCLTDPPFNVKISNNTTIKGRNGKRTNKLNPKAIFYNDIIEDWEGFNRKWFSCIKNSTNRQMIHCGKINMKLWAKIQIWDDFMIHHIPNSFVNGSRSHRMIISPVLIYGKMRLNNDCITSSVKSGFNRNMNLVHPCSLEKTFWQKLAIESKAISIIDPFLGSGTTAQVCEELGIKWLGYEISEDYISDIEKRIKRGQKAYRQQSLTRFIK